MCLLSYWGTNVDIYVLDNISNNGEDYKEYANNAKLFMLNEMKKKGIIFKDNEVN